MCKKGSTLQVPWDNSGRKSKFARACRQTPLQTFIQTGSPARKHLTVDAANKVYTATILPLLDYCDIAWSSIGKTACARLDKLQERASKLILPQSREPLKHLKWLPLAKRRDMHTTTMTFRCMSGKVPVSFKQYFKRNSCPYELRKNKNNLMIPRVNTEIARGSFYYSGAKLYNNLPNKIKTSLSMSALKKFYFK